MTVIYLGEQLPERSSDLPEGQMDRTSPSFLFGLAPGGVCRAEPVTRSAGELLPHRFTLTPRKPLSELSTLRVAVCFLLHFP